MRPVEVCNSFVCMELLSRDPEIITLAVTLPAYEVLKTSPFGPVRETTVKDLLDFPFLFTIDNDWVRRRWWNDTVVVPGAKPVDMDNQVDFEPVWQIKTIV